MKKYYIEGYGCSLNLGETEQISGFLKSNGFEKVLEISVADFIIINTCSVKMVTQQRMISRIQKLFNEKKNSAKIIVTGCLGATNPSDIQKINPEIIVLDTKLENLCEVLKIKKQSFSPVIKEEKSHEKISIIPISVGCVNNCTYCATKLARSKLHSYSIEEIDDAFKRAIKSSKEIHITSQDLGCYGFDNKTNLVELIKTLLKNKRDYRIRLGMMSLQHFHKFRNELLDLFEDERLYKFLHLPVQSGSNKILKSMKRDYLAEEFIKEVNFIRKKIPDITISTDIIVGFPGETKKDFESTINLIKKVAPEVVNISRYGKRKGTLAAIMPLQLTEPQKKERSRIISALVKEILVKKSKKMQGKLVTALVSQKAKGGYFTARTNNYRPILVKSGFGQFVKVKITQTYPNFFKGLIL